MALNEGLEKTSIGEICIEMIMHLGPVWIAFSMGLIVGWMWKPKWVSFRTHKFVCSLYNSYDSSSPSSSSSVVSPIEELDNTSDEKPKPAVSAASSTSSFSKEQSSVVTEEDFRHLWQLVEMKDGGPPWIKMMDRSTETMDYQAWRRDPKTGPPQYRSRTVFEDATSEIVRDFFWDDVFRANWDDMLAYFKTIEECPSTGTMVVQWIRKFPFFCSDREYIVGRRIWEAGRSYYCLTKGVPCDSVPRRDKPRRVDLYYSSWCIRPVESRRSNSQLTACEVLLFHHEEMGIPWEIAKLGIRQGMWKAVKKVEPGLRGYQKERACGAPLSQPAFMAQITTKVDLDYLRALESAKDLPKIKAAATSDKPLGTNVPKLLILGGVIVLACSLDCGFFPRALIFGFARRFANMGKKL